ITFFAKVAKTRSKGSSVFPSRALRASVALRPAAFDDAVCAERQYWHSFSWAMVRARTSRWRAVRRPRESVLLSDRSPSRATGALARVEKRFGTMPRLAFI